MNIRNKKTAGVRGEQIVHKNVYVAFIDVIGVREFAASTAQLYYERIIEFQKALYEKQLFLSKDNDSAVYVYSDCAFMYSKSAECLLNYLTNVRRYAFSRGNGVDKDPLFFKAAIVKGDFESIDVCHLANKGIESDARRRAIPNNIVEGISFSWQAVQVYLAHEESKAIGICVSKNAFDESIKDKLLSNIHFPLNHRDNPQVFTDVRFVESELVDSVLNDILRAFFKAKVKSKKFEKYYVPILCNWIQSLDIKKLLIGKTSTLDQLKEGNGRILYLVGTGYFERAFSSVRGLGYFYLTVLNHIYQTYFIVRNPETKAESIRSGGEIPKPIDAVERYLLRLKRVQNAIPTMPQDFMGPIAREIFLDRLTRLR